MIEDFKKSKKKIFGINADGKKVWSEGLLYLKRKLHDHQDIPYKYGKDISPNESDLHKALAKVVKSNVPNKAHQNEGYVWFLSLLKRNVDKLYNPLIKCSSCNNYVPKNKSVFKLIINEELESFKYYEKEFLDLNFITTIELSKKDSLSFYWENKFHPILKYDLESNYGIDTPDSLKAFIAQNIITKKDINNKSEAIVIDNKIKELSSKIYSKKGLNKKLSTLNAFRLSLLILFGIRYLVMSILWSVRTLKR